MIGTLLKRGIKSLIVGAVIAAGSKALEVWIAKRETRANTDDKRLNTPPVSHRQRPARIEYSSHAPDTSSD